mmetsp:Transcript_33559/g.83110  ORF Transcript_33559/g.83110 Transcript_33559/m.83110 type:complete len:202 (+) Transcript_33559:400-1005(+)
MGQDGGPSLSVCALPRGAIAPHLATRAAGREWRGGQGSAIELTAIGRLATVGCADGGRRAVRPAGLLHAGPCCFRGQEWRQDRGAGGRCCHRGEAAGAGCCQHPPSSSLSPICPVRPPGARLLDLGCGVCGAAAAVQEQPAPCGPAQPAAVHLAAGPGPPAHHGPRGAAHHLPPREGPHGVAIEPRRRIPSVRPARHVGHA